MRYLSEDVPNQTACCFVLCLPQVVLALPASGLPSFVSVYGEQLAGKVSKQPGWSRLPGNMPTARWGLHTT